LFWIEAWAASPSQLDDYSWFSTDGKPRNS
jgi:hypothetical protein